MARLQFLASNPGLGQLAGRPFSPQQYQGDVPVKRSLLGTDVWSNLVFPAGTYQALDGTVIEFETFELDAVLFNIAQSKNIVSTPVQGRNGTVKEYIADGDYQVSIQGMLVGENADTYPEEQMIALVEILRAPVSIKVESEFLSFFDIEEIAISSYNFAQVQGSRNMQPFSVGALSDTPLELQDLSAL